MADTENEKVLQQQDQQPKASKQKQVIAEKVSGTVKWFNVKSGYGFINRNDTKEDVFVHQTAIARNNPRKAVRSVGDGEAVEFAVVAGEKGYEAAGVTGPGGEPVKGSPYAADKRRGFHRQYYPRQSGRGGEGAPRRGGMARRGPPPPQGGTQGDEGLETGVAPPQRRCSEKGEPSAGGVAGLFGGAPRDGSGQAVDNPHARAAVRGLWEELAARLNALGTGVHNGTYFRRNFRGGRRGGGPGPMNRGGYRRMRPRNYQQGQGRQNGQEGDASATSSSPQPQQRAKPKNTNKQGTIETTTSESQA